MYNMDQYYLHQSKSVSTLVEILGEVEGCICILKGLFCVLVCSYIASYWYWKIAYLIRKIVAVWNIASITYCYYYHNRMLQNGLFHFSLLHMHGL